MKPLSKFCLAYAACSLFAFLQALCQSSISGKVQEREGNPLSFANVLLLKAVDSSLVKGMISSEIGLYNLDKVLPGEYMIAASMVGYQQTYSPKFTLRQGNGTFQISPLLLMEDTQELDEVVVEAQKPLYEQQLDRLVVNIQSSITSAGATALEVLERSPGVTVNRQNNVIALVGKEGVVVMINGKPSRLPMQAILQILSGMNASNIEKIELITTPSSSYDAEGNAGIINIILKKNSEYGTNGSYALTLGYGWYEKPAGSFTLNHRTPKLNLFGEYSFLSDHLWQKFISSRILNHQGQHDGIHSISNRYAYRFTHSARLGFDYALGSNTTVAGQLEGFSIKWDMEAANTSDVHRSGQPATLIQMKNDEINHWRHWMGNLNLHHAWAEHQEISADLDYLYYHDNNPSWYYNQYEHLQEDYNEQEEMNVSKRTPIWIWVGKLDYINDIGKASKLEAGMKATLSHLQNDVLVETRQQEIWIPDRTLSQQIRMLEDIGAAYINFQHHFTSKIKLQTGLRWEYTHTNLSTPEQQALVRRRYGILFPSMSVSKEMANQNTLQVSYSRRITRPTYNDLSPFVLFFDPYTFYSGNTSLQPTITDAVQTAYQLKGGYLLSLQYSHDKNAIALFQPHVDPETNKQHGYAENIESIHAFSLTFNLPVSITSWWQMQNNLMGVWQQSSTVYEGKPISLSNRYGSINSTQTFTLPYAFTAELTCFYQTASLFGITIFKPLGSVTAGLQKKLNHDKGTVRLSIEDLFWTNRWRTQLIRNTPEGSMETGFQLLFEPRVVRLTYSRNFGNQKVKSAKRTTGSEEERKRVSGS